MMATTFILKLMICLPSLDPMTQQLANGFQPSDGKNDMPERWGPEPAPVGGWILTAAEVVAGVPRLAEEQALQPAVHTAHPHPIHSLSHFWRRQPTFHHTSRPPP